jgi:hypothetical protein
MAVVWIDNADGFNASGGRARDAYDFIVRPSGETTIPGHARFPGTLSSRSFRLVNDLPTVNCQVWKTLPSALSAVIAGVYVSAEVKPSADVNAAPILLGFGESNVIEAGIAWDSTGALQIRTSAVNGTVRASTTTTYGIDTFHMVEAVLSSDGASGTLAVFVSDTEVLSWTGSMHNAATTFTQVFVGAIDWPTALYYDSLYVLDTDPDTDNTARLGTGWAVRTVAVSADTSDLDWTPDTGASNWSRLLDESLNNTPTQFVSSNSSGDLDLYTLESISAAASAAEHPRAVRLMAWASMVSSTASLGLIASLGSTRLSGPYSAISSTGAYHYTILNSNFDSGSSWEISTVDVLQIGQQVT